MPVDLYNAVACAMFWTDNSKKLRLITGLRVNLRVSLAAAAVSLAVIGILAWSASGAQAASTLKLIGNVDQAEDGVIYLNHGSHGFGQEFTTGSARGGYLLDHIKAPIKNSRDGRWVKITGTIRKVNEDGGPGDIVHTLDDPDAYSNHNDFTFVSRVTQVLMPNTRYMFVITCDSGCGGDNFLEFTKTSADGKDADSRDDWSLAERAVHDWYDWLPSDDYPYSLMFNLQGRLANAPYIVDDGVQIISEPIASADSYGVDEPITVSVEFNRAVEVDTTNGAPVLVMYIRDGNGAQKEASAQYARGSGTTTLVFEYVVKSGDRDLDGIYLPGNLLRLNGAVIKGGSGDLPAILKHPVVGNRPDHKIDDRLAAPFTSLDHLDLSHVTIRPEFRSDRTTYLADVHYDFAETTVVATPPEGGSVVIDPPDADPDTPGHQVELISEVEDDQDGDNVITARVSLDGHIPVTYTVVVKRPARVVPKVVRINIVSNPVQDRVSGEHEELLYTVEFDHPVVVDTTGGRPTLTVELYDCLGCPYQNRPAKFIHGSGTSTLYFQYRVTSQDYPVGMDALQNRMPKNRLSLNGGAIRHTVSAADADLSHAWRNPFNDHGVDGSLSRPAVSKLHGLSLTGVSLSATFRPETTFYLGTPSDGLTTTTVTTSTLPEVTATVLPADADANTEGHQVNLRDGITEIVITTTRPNHPSRTYAVRVAPDLVPDINEVRLTSDPGADGIYVTGDTIDFEVEFDQSVWIEVTDGAPYVAVSVGDNTREATFISVDATGKVLTFSYTVSEDDRDQDGISIAANALTLGDGSITGQASSADANLEHDAPANQAGHMVNNVPNIVADGVAVISSPLAAADTYGEGETIAFTVTFDSNVVVDTAGGIPTLGVDFWHPGLSGQTKELLYVGGSESSTLEFQYVIQAGDRDNTGIAVERNRLRLNGGSIQHATTGRDANLEHPRPDFRGREHKVNGSLTPPRSELSSLSLSDARLSPAFDPAVTAYTAAIAPGVTQATVTATPGTGATATILPVDADTNTAGHQIAVSDGAAITITVAETGKLPVEYTVTIMVRTVVYSVAVTSDPGADGTYATGDVISVAATFNAPVAVDTTNGVPYVAVSVGDNSRNAAYTGIDATGKGLTFSYTVVEDDSDQDGVSIAADALTLDGGSITGQASGADAGLDHDALASQASHIVNKVPRIVADGVAVISSPLAAADTYGEGETIAFTVTFDSNVVVDTTDGIPTLSMEFWHRGGNLETKELAFVRGSGGRSLEFEYVVRPGDRDNSGIVVKQNQLRLNGGSIQHATTGRDADLDHPRPVYGGAHKVDGRLDPPRAELNTLSLTDAMLSPVFDPATTEYTAVVAPGVTETTATATVQAGDTASIEPADADSSASGHQIAVTDGAVITITASGTARVSTEYTVTLEIGTVMVESVAIFSDPGDDGTYATGDVINVALTFNRPVTVDTTDGTPYVAVSVGDNSRNAAYASIDATGKVLTFSYTVAEDDSDQDGISVAANALTLDGGSITAQVGGADAGLNHDALANQAGHIVNKVPRIVADGVAVISSPLAAADTYGEGETIAFTVTFDSDVVVDTTDGVPTLGVDFWHPGRNPEVKELGFVRGSGSTTLEFEYVVQPGDRDNSGIAIKRNQLRLNGGSIQHATTGRDANLEHPRPDFRGREHKVDGRLDPPRAELNTLSLTDATLSPAFDPTTTEYTAVVVPGVTETTATATVQAGDTASIEPADADSNASGHQVAATDGAVITITASGTARISTEYTVTLEIGTVMVDSVAISSDPGADGTYATGDVISVALTFNRPVTVDTTDGTPYVAVSVGDNSRNAAYASIDATGKVLTFSYTVGEDDSDQDGIAMAANTLVLDGGSITGQASGADAVLDHDALASQAGHIVNKVPSIVPNGVVIVSSPLAGVETYGKGETLTFTVTFDSNVVVDTTDGVPTLGVDFWQPGLAGQTKEVPYVEGSGSSTLEFQYVVQAGDRDRTGVAVERNRLRLNGGSIKHETTGRDANLNHGKPNLSGHRVDGRLDPPRAELNTLSLSNATLSPTFDPTVTQYTATVTTDITQTTVTATVLVGHIGGIEPADADANAAGHQVALGTDPTEVSVEVMASGRMTVTYRVTVSKLLEQPDRPANLTATAGDETVALAWLTPAASPAVTGHEYRYRSSADTDYPESWTEIDDSGAGEDNEDGFTVDGLTNGVTYSFQVRAVNSEGASDPSGDATALAGQGLGICDRTRTVRLAILEELAEIKELTETQDCSDVTSADLSTILNLYVPTEETELQVDDFSGLTAMTALDISSQYRLTSLPNRILAGLPELTRLTIEGVDGELPEDIFAPVPTLTELYLVANRFTTLPEDLFSGLSSLSVLELGANGLTELPENVFDGLTSLTSLWLEINELTGLPGGIFDGLSALTRLHLDRNQLTSLPVGVIDDLTALERLILRQNQLNELPDGMFANLTGPLAEVDLRNNATNPILLPVGLEPVGTLQFRAVAPKGAPFNTWLRLTVTDGSIASGATGVTIRAGEVASAILTVEPASAASNPTATITSVPGTPNEHEGYRLSLSSSTPLQLEDHRPRIEGIALGSDPGSDDNYTIGDTVAVQVTFDVAVQVDTTNGTPKLSLTIGDSSAVASHTGIDATGKVLTFQYTVGATDQDQDGVSIAANALSLDGGAITEPGGALVAILDHAAVSNQDQHRVNKDPEIVSAGIAITSTPLAAADTYGMGETISFSVTFDSDVLVDTTGGIPTLSMEFWHPGGNFALKELGFVRGSGGTPLEFEYVVQPGDRDNSGIAIKQNQLRLNGGSIKHATTGRDANLEHPRPDFGGGDHKVNGSLTPPRAELSSLSLSDATLSPRFDSVTTEYTAAVGPAVTQTTVTATVLVGHIGGIEPADADGNLAGHQVSLATGSTTIEIQVMRAGQLAVTYTVTVNKSMESPSRPTNLTAATGDETATLAWVTPPAFPTVTGHEYRYKTSDQADYPDAWTAIADSAAGEDNADGFAVESLANGVSHSFQVRAVNTEGASDPSDEATVLVGEGLGICDRTRTVQVAILEELAEIQQLTEIQDCSDVTSADLSTILDLYVPTEETELKVDDFSGLTAVTDLDISSPDRLTNLPDRIFAGLPELTMLTIEGSVGELPEDIFAPVPTLTELHMYENQFTALPEGLFSGLSSLSVLDLDSNGITVLPENVFDGLTSLTKLRLDGNQLTGLPSGVFDGLSALTRLQLDHNQLTALPVGVIDDLTALERLYLHQNQLNELPDGMFANLSSPLTHLDLRNNATNPILLPVDLESVGTLQFRAVAPKGAPFNITLPLNVTDGSISGGDNGVTILAGEAASATLTVEPASAASSPTVAITRRPGTPDHHDGYRLSLSSSTPLQLEDYRPRIESIALGSDPGSDDTYVAGDAIEALVTFDRAVQVDTTLGTPHVALTIGTGTRNAEYSSADSAGKALTFSYIVVLDDDDSNGVSIAADALALNGGSITNRTTGDDALLTHQALADQSGHLVHNSQERATLTALSLAGITLSPAFTSDVVDYTATVGRDTTETTVSVTAEAGATASIMPADADTATGGHQVSLSRGANEITITVSKSGVSPQTYTVTIDRIWADVTSVAFTSDAGADNIYVTDDVIEVSVTFGAPVVVDTTDGTPYIAVLIGNFYKQATYSGIDPSNRILTFTYTVIAADNDQAGIEIEANSLVLDGGTIKRQGTDFDADLAHDAVDEDPKHLVNETPLLIGFDAVSLVSNPRATQYTYGRGEVITFSFTYSTKVTVDTAGGIPHLLVSVGNADNTPKSRQFDYARGSGTDTLEFDYWVQADDRDSNGIELGEGRLRLNGGAIKHASTGQAASLSYQVLGSIKTFGDHKVDGSLENQTIKACDAEVIDLKARLDICWDLGRAVPTDEDVVIEASSRYLWEWTVDFDLPVQEPAPVWKVIGRGDDYVACGEMDTSCIKFSNGDIFRGAPLTYDLRIRRGDTVLSRSPRLRTQAPNKNDSPLNAKLSSVLLPDKLESYPDRVATGTFRSDLELTDPEVSGVMVEAVKDLELSDFEVTNGVATAIQVSSGGVYVITIEPTTLGQPVTISLPAGRVTGVGEDLTEDGENIYTRGNTASNVFTVETKEP